jgi:hypothetical protein
MMKVILIFTIFLIFTKQSLVRTLFNEIDNNKDDKINIKEISNFFLRIYSEPDERFI